MNDYNSIIKMRNKKILYSILIMLVFIVLPFCLCLVFEYKILMIFGMLMLSFGLIAEVPLLYSVDEDNKKIKKGCKVNGKCV